MKSVFQYVWRSAKTILRIAILYKPLKSLAFLAALLLIPGLIAFARFLVLYAMGEGSGNIQSLVIGATLIAAGVVTLVGGIIADLVSANRVLSAEIRSRLLKAELERSRGA
jgi:hypothetical protein